MKRIQIIPSWHFQDQNGEELDAHLFHLLAAIHEQGKLTSAAETAGISYRHSWNLLNKWSHFFGTELVTLQKGRGAKLTTLGEKLLWAEQRVVARLQPQLENLASELNLEIQKTYNGDVEDNTLLRIHASHGYAVALLPEYLQTINLDLQYLSAVDAIKSLNRGHCDIAGFHIPISCQNEKVIKRYRELVNVEKYRTIRFVTRQLGLVVKPENPKNIHSLSDLTQSNVRFINRQKNSGTRALFDELIESLGINSEDIVGYDVEEFTHSAVAAYIAAGMADVGFGVEAAARQFGLEFISVAQEQYLFLCSEAFLASEMGSVFLEGLGEIGLREAVGELPGYSADGCGEILGADRYL